MKNFRSYQQALALYHSCQKLKLQGALKNQFERALLSIVLNLSEGSAKPTRKDRKKFFFIALGSLREVQSILDIIQNQKLIHEADTLGAALYKLCQNT